MLKNLFWKSVVVVKCRNQSHSWPEVNDNAGVGGGLGGVRDGRGGGEGVGNIPTEDFPFLRNLICVCPNRTQALNTWC